MSDSSAGIPSSIEIHVQALMDMIDAFPTPLQLWRERCILLLFSFLLVVFPASALVVAFHLIQGSWSWFASVVITLYAALVLLGELRSRDWRLILLLAFLLAAAAFALFPVSASTGIPFGFYRFTENLGLLILGVPSAAAAGWIIVVFTTYRIANHLVPPGGIRLPVVAFLGALLGVIFDIVLEPAASFVGGFWMWRYGTVPAQSYLGLFLLVYIFVFLIALARRKTPAPIGVRRICYAVFLMQWGMSAFTCLLHGYFIEMAVSTAALAILFAVYTPWRTGTSLERIG